MVHQPNSIDPFEVFLNATSFYYASRAIDAQPGYNAPPNWKHFHLWPMIVNEAFALELHIKCLHCVRTGIVPRGHDVQQLFNNLSKADRDKIAQHLNAIVVLHPSYQEFSAIGALLDVDSILMRSRRLFQDGRYWYEWNPLSTDSRGDAGNPGTATLCDAIARTLLEVHPDWNARLNSFRLQLPYGSPDAIGKSFAAKGNVQPGRVST